MSRPPTPRRDATSALPTRGVRRIVALEEEVVGAGGPPMSSVADGSAPGPALDPGLGKKLDCEPPLPLVPAPQQEVVASQTEAPAPMPQQQVMALQTEAPVPALQQQEVMPLQAEAPAPQKDVVALQTEAPAPQQDVVALQTEAPAPAVTIVISRPGEEVQAPDAKGVSPASTPLSGGGWATAASVSVTAAAAAKEAELARSDSFDDYEQCR